MIIFIRPCERSYYNYGDLSSQGLVRRNNLSSFFKMKSINKLNTPELIISEENEMDEKICYQTVVMLSHELSINLQQYKSIDDVLSSIEKNMEKDILVCWQHEELMLIIERLIKHLYNYNVKLKWNKNPLENCHDINDHTSIWVLDNINHKLHIYNSFDVIYKQKLYRFDIDYTCISKEPIYTFDLNYSYLNWLKSFFY